MNKTTRRREHHHRKGHAGLPIVDKVPSEIFTSQDDGNTSIFSEGITLFEGSFYVLDTSFRNAGGSCVASAAHGTTRRSYYGGVPHSNHNQNHDYNLQYYENEKDNDGARRPQGPNVPRGVEWDIDGQSDGTSSDGGGFRVISRGAMVTMKNHEWKGSCDDYLKERRIFVTEFTDEGLEFGGAGTRKNGSEKSLSHSRKKKKKKNKKKTTHPSEGSRHIHHCHRGRDLATSSRKEDGLYHQQEGAIMQLPQQHDESFWNDPSWTERLSKSNTSKKYCSTPRTPRLSSPRSMIESHHHHHHHHEHHPKDNENDEKEQQNNGDDDEEEEAEAEEDLSSSMSRDEFKSDEIYFDWALLERSKAELGLVKRSLIAINNAILEEQQKKNLVSSSSLSHRLQHQQKHRKHSTSTMTASTRTAVVDGHSRHDKNSSRRRRSRSSSRSSKSSSRSSKSSRSAGNVSSGKLVPPRPYS